MIDKNKIIVRRPKIEEIDLINEFFSIVLKDTFKINGIEDLKELLDEEIEVCTSKVSKARSSFLIVL